jgi:hypothetical protein
MYILHYVVPMWCVGAGGTLEGGAVLVYDDLINKGEVLYWVVVVVDLLHTTLGVSLGTCVGNACGDVVAYHVVPSGDGGPERASAGTAHRGHTYITYKHIHAYTNIHMHTNHTTHTHTSSGRASSNEREREGG